MTARARRGMLGRMAAVPISVRCEDGWLLHGERLVREDAPAVVVCGHAMGVDRRTLDRPRGAGLASTLFAHGLEVLVMDARGHGQSVPRADQGGRWTYDDYVRQDVPAMMRLARSLAGDRRVVVLGHSLIGHAAMISAGLLTSSGRADAIVGYAPNLWAPHLEPSPIARAAKALLLRAWMRTTRARGYFDARALGVGTDGEAEAYVAQFLAMWKADRLESPGGEIDYEAALGRVTLPVLAFSSEGDRLFARPPAVARFLALMKSAAVEHRVIKGRNAPDHMGFATRAIARPIWEESARWILARAGR